MNDPTAILFDLDDTILSFGDRRLLSTRVAEQFTEELDGLSPIEVGDELEKAFVRFWSDEDNGRVWRFRLLEARILIVGQLFESMRDRGFNLTADFAVKFGTRFNELREGELELFPGAVETVTEFRRRGVKLALVTNGDARMQREKLVRFSLGHLFDHIQIEGEVGFGKPLERAYQHALDALGVSASQTWMVGDNLEWEVAAPQRLGIFSIWHDHRGTGLPPSSRVRPDRIVRRIRELI